MLRVRGLRFDQLYNKAASLAENDYVLESAVADRVLVHVSLYLEISVYRRDISGTSIHDRS